MALKDWIEVGHGCCAIKFELWVAIGAKPHIGRSLREYSEFAGVGRTHKVLDNVICLVPTGGLAPCVGHTLSEFDTQRWFRARWSYSKKPCLRRAPSTQRALSTPNVGPLTRRAA